MPLNLKDGYTVPLMTDTELKSTTGESLYSGLPVISGSYRPALFDTKNAFDFNLSRAPSAEVETTLIAEFIAARVVEWDVTFDGKPAPITAKFIRESLPDPFVTLLLREVRKWVGADEGKQAGN